MQIYKTFLKISLRKLGPCLIFFAIMIGVCTIQSKTDNIYAPTKVKLAVIDEDDTELSKALYDYVDEHQQIEDIGDESKWRDYLFYHTVDYILVINEGFEENLLNGNIENILSSYKVPDSNSTYIAHSSINGFVNNLSLYLNSGYDTEEAISKAFDSSGLAIEVGLFEESLPAQTSQMTVFFEFLPYVLLSVTITSLGAMIIVWNKKAIKARNEVSKQSLIARNTSIILAMVTYTIFLFLLTMAICAVLFTKDLFTMQGLCYSINAALFMFVCLGITLVVSLFSKKAEALSFWSNVIALPTAFLSGIFVPRDLLPEIIVNISKCLPTYWYINVTSEIKYFDGAFNDKALTSLLVQFGFAVAFVTIGLVIIKYRQQKKSLA